MSECSMPYVCIVWASMPMLYQFWRRFPGCHQSKWWLVFWQHKHVAHILIRLERGLTGVARQWIMSLQIHNVYYPHVTFILELALIYRQMKNNLKKEKQLSSNSAFDTFLRAQQTVPSNHLTEYYLTQQFTYGCKVAEAMNHVKRALNIFFEHVLSLYLLILLLCT